MPDLTSSKNAFSTSSVTSRVLRISEIQDHIFSFNEVEDAVRCAIVCKTWTEVALDHVWHTLPSVRTLFNILAPVTPYQEGQSIGFDFTRRIRANDRIRFASFAKRVKSLTIESEADLPCESARNELLKSRSETGVLPNLKVLNISADLEINSLQSAVPFLHTRLEELTFIGVADSDNRREVELFLEEIALRSPTLRVLKFWVGMCSAGSISSSLSQLLANQKSLESLSLLPGMLTSLVLESLSCLPELRDIYIDLEPRKSFGLSASESISFKPHSGGNLFPALVSLDLQTRLISAASFLSAHSNFAQLRELWIDMIFHNDVGDVQRCLEVISETCKGLQVLVLSRVQDKGDRPAVLNVERNPITKDILAPLISLRQLWQFSITHTQPITLSDDDLVDLLTRCPRFTDLHLNPSPLQDIAVTSSLPSFGVIHRVAQCQPDLESLSLYLGGFSAEIEDPLLDVLSMPFDNLETLNVGKTCVSDVDRTVLCLSQVLPSGCEVQYSGGEDTSVKAWDKVKKGLALFTSVFSRQRRQSRELMEKVDTLQKTVDALPSERKAPSLNGQNQDDTLNVETEEQNQVPESKETGSTAEAMSA